MDSGSFNLFGRLGKTFDDDLSFGRSYDIMNQMPLSFTEDDSQGFKAPEKHGEMYGDNMLKSKRTLREDTSFTSPNPKNLSVTIKGFGKSDSIQYTPEKPSPSAFRLDDEDSAGPKIERILFSKNSGNKFLALPDLNLTIRSKGSSPCDKGGLLFGQIFDQADGSRKIFQLSGTKSTFFREEVEDISTHPNSSIKDIKIKLDFDVSPHKSQPFFIGSVNHETSPIKILNSDSLVTRKFRLSQFNIGNVKGDSDSRQSRSPGKDFTISRIFLDSRSKDNTAIKDGLKTCPDQPEPEENEIKCNCKNSKCLKLYCECFRNGKYCSDCNCKGCENIKGNHSRDKAMSAIKTRNPNAFKPRVASALAVVEGKIDPSLIGKKIHTKGCTCKKSGCNKKYCECFQMGVFCSDHCRCKGCKNCDPEILKNKGGLNGEFIGKRVERIGKISPTFGSISKKLKVPKRGKENSDEEDIKNSKSKAEQRRFSSRLRSQKVTN